MTYRRVGRIMFVGGIALILFSILLIFLPIVRGTLIPSDLASTGDLFFIFGGVLLIGGSVLTNIDEE